MRYNRDEGYNIFWQDESWVCKNIAKNKIWQLDSKNSIKYNCYKFPSGHGLRAILCHLGSSETGLLKGAKLCFYGKKSVVSDFHSEMHSELFEDWLKKLVFPKLKKIGKKSASLCLIERLITLE